MTTNTPAQPAAKSGPVPYQGVVDALPKLMNMTKSLELSRPGQGYYTLADARQMSGLNPGGTGALDVGLGWVKGLESLLCGMVQEVRFERDPMTRGAHKGMVRVTSLTHASVVNTMEWIESAQSSPDAGLILGNQAFGPTYAAAQLAFLYLYFSGATELVGRWHALLQNTETFLGAAAPWTPRDIAQLSRDADRRADLFAVADSLRWSYMRWSAGGGGNREKLYCQYDHLSLALTPANECLVVGPSLTNAQLVQEYRQRLQNGVASGPVNAASSLAQGTYTMTTTAVPFDPDADMDLGGDGMGGAIATPTDDAAQDMALAPLPSPGHKVVLDLATPGYRTVLASIGRKGPSFFVGPTAGGKTVYIAAAAQEWLSGHPQGPGLLEVIRFEPGMRSDLVLGSNVPDGTGFKWVDGPALRLFRHIHTTGKPGLLFADELPRAHQSVAALFMGWVEPVGRKEVEAGGHAIVHEDPDDLYHVIRVSETQEVLVLPSHLLKIVGAGNTGESYHQSLRTDDPAFRRRWKAGWTFVREPERDTLAQILGLRLGLPHAHPLIGAMLDTHQAIREYQEKESDLVMALNLDMMISWGREVLSRARDHYTTNPPGAPPAGAKTNRANAQAAKQAADYTALAPLFFLPVATELWLDMVVPLAGDVPNRHVEDSITKIIERCAPKQR